MGRVTYEAMAGALPRAAHPFTGIINAARKVVFSRTLRTAEWANTTIAAGDTTKRSTSSGEAATATSWSGAASASGGLNRLDDRGTPGGGRRGLPAGLAVSSTFRLQRSGFANARLHGDQHDLRHSHQAETRGRSGGRDGRETMDRSGGAPWRVGGRGSLHSLGEWTEVDGPEGRSRSRVRMPDRPDERNADPADVRHRNGATGEQGYLIGEDAFEAYGHPVCYVNFPDFTTADIQVSVQYLVYGLRQEFKMACRKVAVFGISQGGLLPRFALTYWPDLRRKVADVLSAAGTQHGTTVSRLLRHQSVRTRELAADGRPESAQRAQRSAGRDPGRRVLHHRPVGDRPNRAAADRTAADLGARGRAQHPDPERVPGSHDDSHRHRRGLRLVRCFRRRDGAQGQGQEGSRQGLAFSLRSLRPPLRHRLRRSANERLPECIRRPRRQPAGTGADGRLRAEAPAAFSGAKHGSPRSR